MNKFYHIDRLSQLRKGMLLKLTNYSDITPKALQAHVDAMFPDGVTKHGQQYFISPTSIAKHTNSSIELIFEYVRRAHFPDKPSRFQSVFAFKTINDALAFQQKVDNTNSMIWEVEARNSFTADMHLLSNSCTTLYCSFNANLYWEGKHSEMPFWEVLLEPPVKIISAIEK